MRVVVEFITTCFQQRILRLDFSKTSDFRLDRVAADTISRGNTMWWNPYHQLRRLQPTLVVHDASLYRNATKHIATPEYRHYHMGAVTWQFCKRSVMFSLIKFWCGHVPFVLEHYHTTLRRCSSSTQSAVCVKITHGDHIPSLWSPETLHGTEAIRS